MVWIGKHGPKGPQEVNATKNVGPKCRHTASEMFSNIGFKKGNLALPMITCTSDATLQPLLAKTPKPTLLCILRIFLIAMEILFLSSFSVSAFVANFGFFTVLVYLCMVMWKFGQSLHSACV